ncbi:sulfatase-like hydrolase/transferase, partial [Salmonella enterica subsp. enterica serovar Newport]|nr:sulfatase-like hydrolase/transferase [Salmonella enterica subsp. enterica serovar Newport]
MTKCNKVKVFTSAVLYVFLAKCASASNTDFAYKHLCKEDVIKQQDQLFKKEGAYDAKMNRNRYLCYDMNKKPTWKITKKKSNKYHVRVVIIGESTSSDYMSVFGYKHKTTPFLEKVNGLFIPNAISTSANTVQALSRTLLAVDKQEAKSKHQPVLNSPNSIVSLANHTGYTTYFISNQDIEGPWDAANTNIALKSNYYINESQKKLKDGSSFEYFVKNVNPQLHNGAIRNDLNLLYRLRDALDHDDGDKDKMIFLHLWGPHADYGKTPQTKYSNCNLMKQYDIKLPKFNLKRGPKVDCYLQGVYTSDKFIESVYSELLSRGNQFSILYFSDHGHDQDSDPADERNAFKVIHHSQHTKRGYKVPLIVLNSDDKEQLFNEKYFSMFNFIDFFASWI